MLLQVPLHHDIFLLTMIPTFTYIAVHRRKERFLMLFSLIPLQLALAIHSVEKLCSCESFVCEPINMKSDSIRRFASAMSIAEGSYTLPQLCPNTILVWQEGMPTRQVPPVMKFTRYIGAVIHDHLKNNGANLYIWDS